jgi:hypothetical protein
MTIASVKHVCANTSNQHARRPKHTINVLSSQRRRSIDRVEQERVLLLLCEPEWSMAWLIRSPVGDVNSIRQSSRSYDLEMRTHPSRVEGRFTRAFGSTAQQIPWIEFRKGERKDTVVQRYREKFRQASGVVVIGIAQERTLARAATKQRRGRFVDFVFFPKSVCPNHYYVYVLDPEWGPAFIKICGYAPYPIKICLNGHEWAKQQLGRVTRCEFSHMTGFRREQTRPPLGCVQQPARGLSCAFFTLKSYLN